MKKFQARAGFVVQAYRYALDPTPSQARELARHCGAVRVAYNWAVPRINANWAQRRAEQSYGIPDDQRTEWVNWSLPALRKAWNQDKVKVAPWWRECDSGRGSELAGMLRNRRLARSIADAGFGEIRRQLDYKTRWRGGHLVVADRWFPSSKTCSGCGVVKPKLPLRVRVFGCDVCPLVLDRDVNAARNLAALVVACTTGTGVAADLEAQALNGRGADRKTPPGGAGGVETSTPHRKTGQDGDRPLVTVDCK